MTEQEVVDWLTNMKAFECIARPNVVTTLVHYLITNLRVCEVKSTNKGLDKKLMVIRKIRFALAEWFFCLRCLIAQFELDPIIESLPRTRERNQLNFYQLYKKMDIVDEKRNRSNIALNEDQEPEIKPVFLVMLRRLRFSWKTLRVL